MIWHYNCPECHRPVEVDWRWFKEQVLCPNCGIEHYPPTPGEDPLAFVDGTEWPKEMESIVVSRHGTMCAVPGCYRSYATLAHRKSVEEGGNTSAENLLPICAEHAQAKGSRGYEEWVRSLKEEPAAEPVLPTPDFSQTTAVPTPTTPVVAATDRIQPIAAAAGVKLGVSGLPAVQVPFLRGSVGKLVLEYDWRLKAGAWCKVYLVAWPAGQLPILAMLGSVEFDGFAAAAEHSATKDERGTGRVELYLPSMPAGRWTAAFVLQGEGECQITEYVLAGIG
uniref:HNH endonuclease n=1 Tax=candidate division WOR-3 bacterium TaxID=2052148 RepID=A0A7C4CA79_UNCW3